MKIRLIHKSIIVLFLVFSVVFSANAQENFKGIVPMITTRSEVEKKLGKPNENGFYELNEGKVLIRYYDRACERKTECFCLAPLGTVQYIIFTLYQDLYLKDLKLAPNRFKETRSSHLDVYTYSDLKTGIVYEAQDGKVTEISYYESEDTCNKIKQKSLNK